MNEVKNEVTAETGLISAAALAAMEKQSRWMIPVGVQEAQDLAVRFMVAAAAELEQVRVMHAELAALFATSKAAAVAVEPAPAPAPAPAQGV